MEYTIVSAREFAEFELRGDEWRYMLASIRASYRAGSYPNATALASAIGAAAELADHHPDLDVRYPDRVYVSLTTHAVGEVTTRDVEMANRISELASLLGAEPDDAHDSRSQVTDLCIDTMDEHRIRPFWSAVLDYDVASDGSLADPRRQGWAIWFQQMDEPRTQRNRFHLDIQVPHDVAERRIAAALEAGGTLVSDARAKAFWILADAEGNEACICTWQDRQ